MPPLPTFTIFVTQRKQIATNQITFLRISIFECIDFPIFLPKQIWRRFLFKSGFSLSVCLIPVKSDFPPLGRLAFLVGKPLS